jgi:CelD/BcsL family acetyltransferase involved in cellulose biosynthesis
MPSLEIIRTEEEFAKLADQWDVLLESSSIASSPFLTWDWVQLWWKHSQDLCQLRIGILRNSSGKLYGLAPLVLGKGQYGVRKLLRHLSFLGGLGPIVSENMDFIVPRGMEAALTPTLAQVLRLTAGEWDTLDLPYLRSDSPNLEYLTRAVAHLGELKDRFPPVPSLRLNLPAEPDNADKVMSNKSASMHRAAWKKLCTQHQARTLSSLRDLSLDEAFDAMLRMHSMRFGQESSSFMLDRVLAFHRELFKLWAPKKKAFITALEAEGRIIAARYCLIHDGVCYDFQGGFDPALHKYSLGRLVTIMAIADAIRHGARVFDHLPGVQEHKRRLNDHQHLFHHLELLHPSRPLPLLFTLVRGLKRKLSPIAKTPS